MTHHASSQTPLSGMRVAVLVAEGVEDLEYWVTVMRLREAGASVTSVGMTLDAVHGKNGLAARADVLAAEADASGFDGLVIPGGWLPDKLRRYDAVTNLVRAIHDAGKPIGIICHGGSVAISAGIIQAGHPATGSTGIKDDLDQRGRTLGRRAGVPRRDARMGPCCRRHPGLRARARCAVRRAPCGGSDGLGPTSLVVPLDWRGT